MSSASSSASSGAAAGPAGGPQLWERAWSLEEVRTGSQAWSLAADAGLLQFLQEFSQQTISRTHEIKKQMDRLINETKSTDCRLHNVFNGFLMLSNTQFIENRVYDEEVEEHNPRTEVGDKPEQEKTREQKEADLIPKIQEAVNYGLQVLDSAFEQLDVKAGNSDSEEETNERSELILEPKDLYIDRPLPYLIGSQLFMEQDDVGLGDISSEEGSIDSDHGSMIGSEGQDEEELEDFGNISEEDQKPRTALMSDEDDDLFGDSEKGEEGGDLEENAMLKKKTPTSFTDELAARIKGDALCHRDEEQLSGAKSETLVKDGEAVNVPSDDEEDIFKPPRLTDEDFSPFGSKGGLFSGGTGLFEDEDDEESDLFVELPKGEDETEKEVIVPINDEPSSKVVKKVPAGAVSLFPGGSDVFSPSFLMAKGGKSTDPTADKASKLRAGDGLFDHEDFQPHKNGSVSAGKPAADLFDDDVAGDLFKEKPEPVSSAAKGSKELIAGDKSLSSAENFKPVTRTPSKDHRSLFSDEEDSEDLFSSNPSVKSKCSSSSSSKMMTTKAPLFEDEDEEELFGSVRKTHMLKPSQEKAASLLFSSDEEDHWNMAREANPAPKCNQKTEATKPLSAAGSHTIDQTSLFGVEEEEDLFAITKESQRTSRKAALLFEDDIANEDSLFDVKPTHLSSGVPAKTQADALEKSRKNLEEKVGALDERSAAPASGPGGGSGTEQPREPLLEKDPGRKTKSLFSLFEEDEKNEDTDVNKSSQKEKGKQPVNSASLKSTGVFQDEELLFSHKLQKDNDPDVDLFASSKKEGPKPRLKRSSVGGLFGVDDEDDDDDNELFGSAKEKPLVAKKKAVLKQSGSVSSAEKEGRAPERGQSAGQEEEPPTAEAPQKSTGPAGSKHKDPSSWIGKLQANLDINPAALLPTGTSGHAVVKVAPLLSPETPCPEPGGGRRCVKAVSAAGSSEERRGVSFDDPMQANTLQNPTKGRIKMSGKRRPPTRTTRQLHAQQSQNKTNVLEENSVLPATLCPTVNREPCREEDPGDAKLFLSTNSSDQLFQMDRSPDAKPAVPSDADDLFEPSSLFANSVVSKVASKSETETLASQVPPRGGGRLSIPLSLDGPNHEDLFHSVKPSKKPSPVSFLEDQAGDLFTSKRTLKRKDSKPAARSDQAPPIQDIFEDDIFASETANLPARARELEANLFDDDVDIFADLAVKPKERSAKKKMEAKSIFDEDTDDIFSPGSQSKALTKKAQPSQTASGTKSELKASSSFEDPLNAFEDQ